ncbi:MAG: acetate--CoA ligase family protein [Promethearchaeota archaeon]
MQNKSKNKSTIKSTIKSKNIPFERNNIPFERNNIPFERLFNPRAIAVIGASKDPMGGSFFVQILKSINYPHPVYPVNPKFKGEELLGYKTYNSISSLPEEPPIDLVIIAVPAGITPTVIKELGQKKVLFAHIFSSGYSEIGREQLEQELLKRAKESKIRILGPNCMGIYNPRSKVAFFPGSSTKPGPVGFISQSGGLGGRLVHWGPSVGFYFSKIVSLGNQIDLDLIDFLRYFKDDPDTKVIGMYVENLKRDGNEFVQLLKETTIKKPVIIWKGGVSETGHMAVMSHTGGLAGDYTIWKSMAKQTGTILINDFYELSYILQALLMYPLPKTQGVAIITGGGGLAVECTDACERNGLKIPPISEKSLKKISQFIPQVNTNIKNPLDLGGAGFQIHELVKTISILNEEPQISVIIMVNTPEYFSMFGDMGLQSAVNEFAKVLSPEKLLIGVPVLHQKSKESIELKHKFTSKIQDFGILSFESIDDAAKCCYKLWEYGDYLKRRISNN